MVIVVTVVTVLGVTVVVIKIRDLKHVTVDVEKEDNVYDKPVFTSKRLSWTDSPWNFRVNSRAPSTNFQCEHLMREQSASDYEYANTEKYCISSDVSSGSNCSRNDSNSSNHYACADVSSDYKMQYSLFT